MLTNCERWLREPAAVVSRIAVRAGCRSGGGRQETIDTRGGTPKHATHMLLEDYTKLK